MGPVPKNEWSQESGLAVYSNEQNEICCGVVAEKRNTT